MCSTMSTPGPLRNSGCIERRAREPSVSMLDAFHGVPVTEGPTPVTTNAALFGELLRHFREAAFLTQEALARQIPCDRSLVARVEAGTRVPSDAFAKKCDEVLGTGGVLGRLWGK